MSIKASVTHVYVGPHSIEGLMNVHGEFGVGVPQFADTFSFLTKNASRDIKALLRKDFSFLKWQTPLNSKPVNVIILEHWSDLVFELALKGNPKAIEISRALHGMSWHQLFCDAFGKKFEAEDRQHWLASRLVTKIDFRELTDRCKRSGFTEPQEYARFTWCFQTKLGIDSGTRDQIPLEKLVALQGAQAKLIAYMDCGLTPWQAIAKL